MFAGIGGFRTGLTNAGDFFMPVGWCEKDKHAQKAYRLLYGTEGEYFCDDARIINPADMPDFDLICGGFPCQPFSVAGLKRGFEDTRGTLFFNIANIVKYKQEHGCPPKVLFLENVRGLKSHDKGNTLNVIIATLEELGYGVSYTVLNAKYFGVPQNRERLFIIAWYKELIDVEEFNFPYGIDANGNTIYSKEQLKGKTMPTKVSDIFEPDEIVEPFTISDRMWEGHQRRKERNMANGKGFGYRKFDDESSYCSTISARYWKDGSEILIEQKGSNPRKITPREASRLQGFPSDFIIPVSDTQAYKQFGNSVAVPVINAIAEKIISLGADVIQ